MEFKKPEGVSDEAVQMAKDIFQKFDADHSGTIDKEEAKAIFMQELKKTGQSKINFNQEQFDNWFSKADVNNDGSISFEEACTFVQGFYIKGWKSYVI